MEKADNDKIKNNDNNNSWIDDIIKQHQKRNIYI